MKELEANYLWVKQHINRGGSLPEIWNNLPDGGQFSWVPVLLQIQVKFLYQIHVLLFFCLLKKGLEKKVWRKQFWVQPMRPVCKHIFTLFPTSVKKGLQKAIMGTATTVLSRYGYPKNSLNSHIWGGFDGHYCSFMIWVPSKLLEFPHTGRIW